jgi:hypothetical protein
MDNLFENKAATEVANEEMMFNDMLEAEADVVLEAMTTGENPFGDEDEVSRMVDEDEEDDEINKELEEEDNNFANASKANEAAALTGLDFLNSICRDTNDPITTKPGSIGQQDSAASFGENFSSEFDDNNDPIKTEPGSVGMQESTANHSTNFSDEADDNNDPITTDPGSVGQKDSTAKDPAVESAMVFGELMGTEVAMEGIISKLSEKISTIKKDRSDKRREADVSTLGIQAIDSEKVDSLIKDKKYDQAIQVVNQFIEKVKSAVDENDKAKVKAGNRLTRSFNSLIVAIQTQKIVDEEIAKGTDPKEAEKIAVKRMMSKSKELKDAGKLDEATESAINMAIQWTLADEADLADPEATVDGSVGQKNSAAHNSANYSNGELDNNDPVKTKDGAEGQEDSEASFDENHSGGTLDSNDPIQTDDGSVGQKDSTAKDPASESTTALEELEALNQMMNEEVDGMDDPTDF